VLAEIVSDVLNEPSWCSASGPMSSHRSTN